MYLGTVVVELPTVTKRKGGDLIVTVDGVAMRVREATFRTQNKFATASVAVFHP